MDGDFDVIAAGQIPQTDAAGAAEVVDQVAAAEGSRIGFALLRHEELAGAPADVIGQAGAGGRGGADGDQCSQGEFRASRHHDLR